jgi:hypothetical protein
MIHTNERKPEKAMKTAGKLLTALLALAFILCAAACTKTPAPETTPEPATEAPATEAILTRAPASEAPATEAPTDPGNVMDLYNFDPETRRYQDMYIDFTLPKGQTVLVDSTAEWDGDYIRYIFFRDPENLEVNTSCCVQPAEGDVYANFTAQDFEELFRLFYERSLEAEVEIETLRYEMLDGVHFSGVTYEYAVKYDEAEIRQLLYSVVTEAGVSITVVYTFEDEAAALVSKDSIRIN